MNVLDPKRFPNESYDEYKARKRAVDKTMKRYQKGTVVYPSRVWIDGEGEGEDRKNGCWKRTKPFVAAEHKKEE